MATRIGIDLGGTKIEIAVLSSDGEVLHRNRVPTPRGSYDGTVRALVELVASAESVTGTTATVGIGMPGAVSPATGLVKNANSVWLNGRSLHRDLEQAMGRPIRLANDANCFALSEATDGAGAGAATVFGVIIGTGTGGGVVVHGRACTGPNAIAGEWGHNPLPWPDDDERPGPGVLLRQVRLHRDVPVRTRARARLSSCHRARPCGACDRRAAPRPAIEMRWRALERYAHRMARSLASIINVLDPDVIVLGGGMSNVQRLYTRVPELLPQFVFSDRVDNVIRPPRHGDASGVRGAAWLWND